MTSFRKYLTILLAMLMLLSCAVPALAAEGEETLPAEDTASVTEEPEQTEEPAGETEEAEEPASAPAEEPEEASEAAAEDASAQTEAAEEPLPPLSWQEPGNSTANIQGGGKMLTAEDAFFYSEYGLWKDADGETVLLAEAYEAGNLNLSDGWLYFTDPSWGILRVPANGGEMEVVLAYDSYIEQMYVIGRELRFVADGNVYSYDMGSEALSTVYASGEVLGLLPTEYGNIYITGDPFDRHLWIGEEEIFTEVQSCYTEQGYLILSRDGDWQIALADLFNGSRSLAAYSLRANEYVDNGLTMEEALLAEQAFFESPEYEAMMAEEAAAAAYDGVSAYATSVVSTALTNGSASQNQINIAKRARQMSEVEWTPLTDRYAWGGSSAYRSITDVDGTVSETYFVAGKTYRGIPYAQAVYTGYVGWDLSISDYSNAVNDSGSKFYSGYSTFNKTAPYYGSDCSGFVSWAWQLNYRRVCSGIGNAAVSKNMGTNYNNIQLGDCLNDCSTHVVLVTDIGYNASGQIVSIEITEQTPAKMKVTVYGDVIPGKRYDVKSTLAYLQSSRLNAGYDIYRRTYSGSVTYTPDPSVPIDEDGWISAPSIKTQTSSDGTAVEVVLSHSSGHNIYYTVDGSLPTLSSTLYEGPICLTQTATVRALVDPGDDYDGSFRLDYTVKVTKADAPVPSVVSGAYYNLTAKQGSFISLYSENGDKIYYTTDGTEPTMASAQMTDAGIEITDTVTIKCFAFGSGAIRSDVATYTIKIGNFYQVEAALDTDHGTIYPSGVVDIPAGEDFTFNIRADSGYKVADVLVDGRSVGAVETYTFSKISGSHSISATFCVDLPYTDVANGRWYADAVSYVYSNKYFMGITDNTFGPNSLMTRGMLVTVLGRYAGLKSYLESFTDTLAYSNGYDVTIRNSASTSGAALKYIDYPGEMVRIIGSANSSDDGVLWYKVVYDGTTGWVRSKLASGKLLLLPYENNFQDLGKDYYYGYVQWAYLENIINGRSSNTFDPKGYISRQDLCVVLYNYLTEYLGKSLSTTATKTYTDSAKIQSYAVNAVNAMTNIGVIAGHDDGSFGPNEGASRAQVAQILLNLNNYLKS